MSNDNAGRPGRTNGSAPMGSTVAIVVTLIALVLGFLILRKVNDKDSSTTSKPTDSTVAVSTTVDPAATVAPTEAPTTTVPELVTTGTKVQVANASSINGAAASMSKALTGKGFDVAEPPVSSSEKKDVSEVRYNADDPAALAVANSLAVVMGNIAVVAQGIPVPVPSGNWAEGSGVLLLLGNDSAGKTLAEISGAPVTGVTTAVTTTTTV